MFFLMGALISMDDAPKHAAVQVRPALTIPQRQALQNGHTNWGRRVIMTMTRCNSGTGMSLPFSFSLIPTISCTEDAPVTLPLTITTTWPQRCKRPPHDEHTAPAW